jgi:integrase
LVSSKEAQVSPVVKRGKTWSVIVELPRNPQTNKRRQEWHSGYRTKREALDAEVQLKAASRAGTYVPKSKQFLDDYLTEWLAAIEPTIRPSTHYSYTRNLRLHVRPSLGSVPVKSVDAGMLNALYACLLQEGSKHSHGGGLSPRTVYYIHTILHRALKDAVRWGRLARNPADAADPPRASANSHPTRMKTWTADELHRFLEAVSGDALYPAFLLLATGAMRRGEALGLRWGDVDLQQGRASIHQTVIPVAHKVQFGTPKTGKGRRVVGLDGRTVTALRAHRQRQLELRMSLGAGWNHHDLLFTKPTGEPLHPERFSRAFDRIVNRLGLPRIPLHGLRHTWATLALRAGVHPKVVQERLGHASISITLDIYSHAIPAMQTDAAERVVSLVFGDRG